MSRAKKVVVGDCFKMYPNALHPNADAYIMVAIDEMYYGEERYIQSLSGTHTTVCYTDADRLPTLHLPIKGEWFEKIECGEKKHEYREIEGARDTFRNCPIIWGVSAARAKEMFIDLLHNEEFTFAEWMRDQNQRDWKVLHLTAGYDPNGKRGLPSPQLWVHIEGISIGRGNPEWGAPTDRDVFIIHLGDVFHTKNVLKPADWPQ